MFVKPRLRIQSQPSAARLATGAIAALLTFGVGSGATAAGYSTYAVANTSTTDYAHDSTVNGVLNANTASLTDQHDGDRNGVATSSSIARSGAGGLHFFATAEGSASRSQVDRFYFGAGAYARGGGAVDDAFVVNCPTCQTGARGSMTFQIYIDGLMDGGANVVSTGQPGLSIALYSVGGDWRAAGGIYAVGLDNYGVGDVSWRLDQFTRKDDQGTNYVTGAKFGSYEYTVPIVFGANNYLNMYGWASAFAGVNVGVLGGGASISANAAYAANLSNTYGWGGITELRDADGNLVSGFTALSETSGFDYANRYTDPQNAVPEPGTWALMILGFGSAGVMLRRRQVPA